MAVRIAPLDDNLDFPEAVQARQAERLGDSATPEGSAVAGMIADQASTAGNRLYDQLRALVRVPSIDALVATNKRPLILAHRSACLLAPENTAESARYALGLPNVDIVDVADIRTTQDGAAVVFHDESITSKTSLPGVVGDYPLAALLKRPVLEVSRWFRGGWSDAYIATMDKLLGEVGGKYLISAEAKDNKALDALEKWLTLNNIGPSFLTSQGDIASAARLVRAGATGGVFQTSTQIASRSMAELARSMRENNIHHIQVQHGSDLAKVRQLVNEGLNVWIYNLFRHHEVAVYEGIDLVGYVVDDPLYTPGDVNVYRRPVVSWPRSGTFGPGHLGPGNGVELNSRGYFVGQQGAWRWAPVGTYNLIGEICPFPNPTSYTLTIPVTFDKVPASALTQWAGMFFGQDTDFYYNNGFNDPNRKGYNLILRANGQMQLYRVDPTGTTNIGTSGGAAIAEGATVTVAVKVTATSITVTRSDGGPSITVSDAAYRGGYLQLGRLGPDLEVSYGAVAVA